MIHALLAVAIIAPQDQGEMPSPSQVVSKMLAKYSDAKTLVGRIQFVQSADNVGVTTDTVLQFEKPAKLYIFQARRSSQPAQALVTSDGKRISYNAPNELAGGEGVRLIESLSVAGRTLDIKTQYAISSRSLLDRSAMLDIVISRTEDLQFVRGQWATLEYGKMAEGAKGYLIQGDWREYPNAQVSGKFRMLIGEDHELKQYAVYETVSLPNNLGTKQVTSLWTSDIQINGKVDPNLFKVRT